MLRATAGVAVWLIAASAMAASGVELALETATREAGTGLDPTPVYDTTGPSPTRASFVTADGVEPRRVHHVLLSTGRYLGYDEAAPTEAPRPVTREQALETARRIAAARLPDAAPSMEWKVEATTGTLSVTGALPPPPAAPRWPTTACEVRVSEADGSIQYREHLRAPAPPVAPAVTAQEAVGRAAALLGSPSARPLEDPHLWPGQDGAEWHMQLAVPGCDCVAVAVNAQTGEAHEIGRVPGAIDGPARPAALGRPGPFPWFPVGGGAALVVLAAAALILRRRAHP